MKIKVTNHCKLPKQVRFSDIEQGGAFLDCNGELALKVSPTQWYSFDHSMLITVSDVQLPFTVVNAEITYTDTCGSDTDFRTYP